MCCRVRTDGLPEPEPEPEPEPRSRNPKPEPEPEPQPQPQPQPEPGPEPELGRPPSVPGATAAPMFKRHPFVEGAPTPTCTEKLA